MDQYDNHIRGPRPLTWPALILEFACLQSSWDRCYIIGLAHQIRHISWLRPWISSPLFKYGQDTRYSIVYYIVLTFLPMVSKWAFIKHTAHVTSCGPARYNTRDLTHGLVTIPVILLLWWQQAMTCCNSIFASTKTWFTPQKKYSKGSLSKSMHFGNWDCTRVTAVVLQPFWCGITLSIFEKEWYCISCCACLASHWLLGRLQQ